MFGKAKKAVKSVSAAPIAAAAAPGTAAVMQRLTGSIDFLHAYSVFSKLCKFVSWGTMLRFCPVFCRKRKLARIIAGCSLLITLWKL